MIKVKSKTTNVAQMEDDVPSNLLNKRLTINKIETAKNEKIDLVLKGLISETTLSKEEMVALEEKRLAIEKENIERQKREAEEKLREEQDRLQKEFEERERMQKEEQQKALNQSKPQELNSTVFSQNGTPMLVVNIPPIQNHEYYNGSYPLNNYLPATQMDFPTVHADSAAVKQAVKNIEEETLYQRKYEEHLEQVKAQKKRSPSGFHKLFNFLIYSIIFLFLFICIKTFVISALVVRGTSMEPSYHDGDNILIDRITYKVSDGKLGDVVVVKKENSDHFIIKRIVAQPGDKVQIIGGILYVNEIAQDTKFDPMDAAGIAEVSIQLKDDEYFVLGDNRTDSKDSRDEDVGPIKRSEIYGRVFSKAPIYIAILFSDKV